MKTTFWLPAVLCIILFLVLLIWLIVRNIRKPVPYNLSLSQHPGDTIFVSVASYRDELCPSTLQNLFERAAAPQHIYVGLCLQNAKGDAACPADGLCINGTCYADHVRTHSMKHTQAKGPAYARYHCAQLYRGERFFLQIDSHMEFVQDWDAKILRQWRAAPVPAGSAGAVLTHYPPADMTDEVRQGKVTTHICNGKFEPDGMVSFLSTQHGTKPLPMRTYFLAGGFLFGPGTLVAAVPYDPHLLYLFWGEEVLLAARLWTSGYDIFSPSEAVCSHVYERFDKPNVFTDTTSGGRERTMHKEQDRVHRRVKQLLGWEPQDGKHREMDKYGMGSRRPLAQFLAESKIDVQKKTVGSHCG
jgi:[Skp1-protein]-hydroxyproline N-acetylglucosaminyltransferase